MKYHIEDLEDVKIKTTDLLFINQDMVLSECEITAWNVSIIVNILEISYDKHK